MSSRKHVIGSLLFKEIDCRPVAPAEPPWDSKAHTVCTAFAHFRDLDNAPRIKGGKGGTKQVRDRLEARQRAWELLDEWVEARRLDGRPVDGVSMTQGQVVRDSAPRKASKTGT